MREITWHALDEMSYEQVKALTTGGEEFFVLLPIIEGSRTQRFLEIEANYLSGSRSIRERLRYFWGVLRSKPPIQFLSLWNRALMDGFRVVNVGMREADVAFYFAK
jgi:hypothetical protein